MTPVRIIEGAAAPLLVDDVSTDIISPSFLLATVNTDLAGGLFAPWRYRDDGGDNPDFVLNQPRFRDAKILLAGRSFGCGSSREHAVWCLQRFGIGCVIAPSFGDIFFENAFKNGLVALTLPAEMLAELAASVEAANRPDLTVDLETRTIAAPGGQILTFGLDDSRRAALLEGLSEIDFMLRERDRIDAYQAAARREQPWLFPDQASVDRQLAGVSP